MFELTTWPRSPWSIFNELESLQDTMNKALSEPSRERPDVRRYRYPLMNVWSAQEGLIIDAELPGVNPGDVERSTRNRRTSGRSCIGRSVRQARSAGRCSCLSGPIPKA